MSNVLGISPGDVQCIYYGGVKYALVISSSTWQTFESNINDVRVYKSLSEYSFSTSGYLTSLYNKYHEALSAICEMAQGSLQAVGRGVSNITNLLNSLETQLNSIT
jgi:hypothetical protein